MIAMTDLIIIIFLFSIFLFCPSLFSSFLNPNFNHSSFIFFLNFIFSFFGMAQPPSANDLIIQLTAQLDQAELQGRALIGEGYDNTNVGQHGEWRFCVVSRLFSDRAVNFDAFQHTIAIAWILYAYSLSRYGVSFFSCKYKVL